MSHPVVIIGAGLSGLTAARLLGQQGVETLLLESADGVGGRVRTDEVEGFQLDRGFQVLLTAYPEAQQVLDYDDLDLQPFEPGSMIRLTGEFARLSDPWRQPARMLETALSPVGALGDKLRIARLRRSACSGTLQDVFRRDDVTTEAELRRLGFRDEFVDRFMRPFLGGVFLDRDLQTSCRMMYFVFRMFSLGNTAIPAQGMGAISDQLAEGLPEDSVRLSSTVSQIREDRVLLQSGDSIPFRKLIVATEQAAAARLLPELKPSRKPRRVRCVYFAAARPPIEDRMLVLNGSGAGIVNNLCVPSQIASSYAPDGQALVSATVLDDQAETDTLHEKVQAELKGWFGGDVESWKHLRTYDIPEALPNQSSPAFEAASQPSILRDNVLVCGDYRFNGSINGAMESGRLAAEAIMASDQVRA